MTLGNRVFVSSTCYDLIDLRAEVERGLRDMGLAPVMSDRGTSDFALAPDRNSIETCLVNLESCDHVIVILSQRYGPTLESYDYPNKSATQVEYERALASGKPVYFYVRNHLMADYNLWKKNPENKNSYTWCKDKEDPEKLFVLIKQQATPPGQSEKRNNWIQTFESSVDLIQQIRRDLAATSGEALLRRHTEQGELPEIRITIPQRVGPNASVCFTNHGKVAALDPKVRIRQKFTTDASFSGLREPIDPDKSVTNQFTLSTQQSNSTLLAVIDIQYSARGLQIMETFTVDSKFRYGYQGKTLVEHVPIICQLPKNPWQEIKTEQNGKP